MLLPEPPGETLVTSATIVVIAQAPELSSVRRHDEVPGIATITAIRTIARIRHDDEIRNLRIVLLRVIRHDDIAPALGRRIRRHVDIVRVRLHRS